MLAEESQPGTVQAERPVLKSCPLGPGLLVETEKEDSGADVRQEATGPVRRWSEVLEGCDVCKRRRFRPCIHRLPLNRGQ